MTARRMARGRASGRGVRPWLAAAVAVLATLALTAQAAAAQTPGAAQPVVLPVWALADGDTPVSGARVRVYAPGRRAPLRQRNGARQERTYGAGMALLEFSQLPRRLTVEVTGGRAGGRRLRGAFRAVVGDYRPGSVVHVNPVTTLIAAHVASHRRLGDPISRMRARREIYRLLRIAPWQNQADLRASDRSFDGDAYLRAVRRAGGVAALNRTLIREELRTGDRPRRFRGHREGQAGATAVDWLSLLAGDPRTLVKEAFKVLGLFVASNVGQVAAQKGSEAALGWVLAAFGFGDVFKDQDVLEVRRALDVLGKQLTQLQGEVQLGGFSTLVRLTDRTIGQIDHASSQLALLAKMPAGDPTKRAYTKTVTDYIGANLLDAPAILNQSLGTGVPLADNPVKSASRLVAERSRFFDTRTSATVKSVYDYFAAYQVKLALLHTEYFHAKPETYSPANAKASLDGIAANVEAQVSSLKPAVPGRAVVDTRSGLMWTQDIQDQTDLSLLDIAEIVQPRKGTKYVAFKPRAGPVAKPGLPFANWRLPSIGEYEQLLADWSGATPSAWLQDRAGIARRMLDAGGGQMWVRDGFRLNPGFINDLDVQTFTLQSGRIYYRGSITWFFADGWRGDFASARAGALYRREVPAGETYWWGG